MDPHTYIEIVAKRSLLIAERLSDTDPELAREIEDSCRFIVERLASRSYKELYISTDDIAELRDRYSDAIVRCHDFTGTLTTSALLSPTAMIRSVTKCSDCIAEVRYYGSQFYELRYNPVFLGLLPEEDRVFVLLHEILHVLSGHAYILFNIRSVTLWNIAADLYVNEALMSIAKLRPRILTPLLVSLRTLRSIAKKFCSIDIDKTSEEVVKAKTYTNYIFIENLYHRCRKIALTLLSIPGYDIVEPKFWFSGSYIPEYEELYRLRSQYLSHTEEIEL